MRIQSTRAFDREFKALPATIMVRAEKQIRLPVDDPRHPSLRLKKMQGTEEIWEARITRGYRMTIQISGEVMILRRIGTHDVLKRP